MDVARARYLVSAAGREALASAESVALPGDPVALSTALRRALPPGEAAAIGEQVALRRRARERLGEPFGLLTPAGLEMMTHPLVARRRAARLALAGLPVVDLTCGLGGDLRAAADAGLRCAGLEFDAATAILARANVPGAAVVRGSALRPSFRLAAAHVLLDPSRRGTAGRTFDPRSFDPPWDACLALAREARGAVIKAPPGIDHRALPGEAEVEFVELGRGLREGAAWLGEGAHGGLRRAVLLPSAAEIDSTAPEAPAACAPIGAFLFDPRSCVTRAGLVRHVAARIGASLLDPSIAYLTAPAPAWDPVADCFEVLDVVPFSLARLKSRLAERRWRPHEIRRRAFPIEPDELRRLLGRPAGAPITLLCTTLGGRRTVVVARAWPAGLGGTV
jgi:hypothetical protein